MDYSDIIIFIMELIGTVAFASSGAMLAMQKAMDVFGVCVLGVVTAVGGGLIRDLILGITPPGMFRKPVYTLVALGVSIFLFIVAFIRHSWMKGKVATAYDLIMTVFDALGLGIFTVVGINTAWSAGYEQRFLLVFVGVLTGVGGGLMRDVMAQVKPYILHKHIYACASIAGALVCVLGKAELGRLGAMVAGAAVVILIRFLAAHYRWNLPRVQVNEEENERKKAV